MTVIDLDGDQGFSAYTLKVQPMLSVEVSTLNGISPVDGMASYDHPGTFELGPATFLAGPEAGGVFPTDGTQTFSFREQFDNALTGQANWSALVDGPPGYAHLVGTLDVLTSTGSPDFLGEYGPGSTASIDLTLSIPDGACSVTQIVTHAACPSVVNTGIEEPALFHGVVNPSDVPVPEPIGWLVCAPLLAVAALRLSIRSRVHV